MSIETILENLNSKLRDGISLSVVKSYDIYELTFSKNNEFHVITADLVKTNQHTKYYFEFHRLKDLHVFNELFQCDIPYLKIAQNAYSRFSFIFYYLFGIQITAYGYPENIKDLQDSFYSDISTYYYGFVVTAEKDTEPLRVTSNINFNVETNQFEFELNFQTNFPYGNENFYMECTQIDNFIVKLLKNYACKPLSKKIEDLKLIDSQILRIINYN